MICPNCKKNIEENSVFCNFCGFKINYNMESGTEEKSDITADADKQRKKSGKKWTRVIIAVVCIALVIIAGTVFGVQYSKNRDLIHKYETLVKQEDFTKASEFYKKNGDNSFFVKSADKRVKTVYFGYIKDAKYEEAAKLFNSELFSEKNKKSIVKKANKDIDDKVNQFILNKIEYSDAKSALESYMDYDEDELEDYADDAIERIEALNGSRIAYADAEEDIKNENYESAIGNLKKVIEEDENYEKAQNELNSTIELYKQFTLNNVNELVNSGDFENAIEKLLAFRRVCDDAEINNKFEEIRPQYKQWVMTNTDVWINANDYDKALNALDNLKRFVDDTEVNTKIEEVKNKKEEYDKAQMEQRILSLKDLQQVNVVSTDVWDDGFSIVFMKGKIVVNNNTDKVAKDVYLSVLQFDANGYPVDVDYSIYEGNHKNEYRCQFDSCNILPGKAYGTNAYFSLSDKCKKIKACVKKVVYTDGSTWENEYYKYWLEENYSMY